MARVSCNYRWENLVAGDATAPWPDVQLDLASQVLTKALADPDYEGKNPMVADIKYETEARKGLVVYRFLFSIEYNV